MKIAIIGGGIAGLALAVALEQQAIDYTLYESTETFRPLGAGIGIGSNAMLALQGLAVGEAVLANGEALKEQRFYNRHMKQMNSIDFTQLKEQFGEETITVHRADLHQALFDQIPASRIRFGQKVKSVTQNEQEVRLTFMDDGFQTFDVVVGADGIHSKVRQAVAPTPLRYAGYTCWRGICPNDGTVPSGVSSEAWSKEGRFGFAPMADEQMYWFACINAKANDPTYKTMKQAEVASRFAHFSQEIASYIESTQDATFLHHDIYDIQPLPHYVYDRIILIGDAAHATTPNMGQGAGQAIEDAYALSRGIQAYGVTPKAFAFYEQERLPVANQVIRLSRQIGWAAQWSNPLLVGFRDTVFPFIPKQLLFRRLTFLFKK